MTSGTESKIRKPFRSIGLGLAAGLVVLGALAAVAWYQAREGADSHESPASYEGTRLGDPAPGFRLVDQNGASRSLEDFRGKVVVLTLLDPVCTDICPIYAYHYRLAYQALGQDAARVALLAFNANDEKTSVEDMMAATRKWGVDEIPSWHFLTGSPDALRAVWKAYGMMASGPPKPDRPDEKQHSPSIYVIDQAGQRRWYFSTNFEGAPPPSALIVKHVKALLAEERRQ
jgi:cytochrome oxidase Cu insertion factor (SCO1/SenC/PrrC family)